MACYCVMPECVRVEKDRLDQLGAAFLGSCGDKHHTYGFHCPPCRLPPTDYSLRYGRGDEHTAAAGDFGMNWVGSRNWLALFITQLRAGLHPGVVEVIGSLDGRLVNYWCRWDGWKTTKYTGQGHDTWTHIGFDRTKTGKDQQIFEGGSVPLSDVDINKVADAVYKKIAAKPIPLTTGDIANTADATFKKVAAMQIPNTATEGYDKLRTLPQALGDVFHNGPNGKMWPQSTGQQLATAIDTVDNKVDQLLPTASAINAGITSIKEALAALVHPEQIP